MSHRHVAVGGGAALLVAGVFLSCRNEQSWQTEWEAPDTRSLHQRQVDDLVTQGVLATFDRAGCRVGPAFAGLDWDRQSSALLLAYNLVEAPFTPWPVTGPDGQVVGHFTPDRGLAAP